MITMVNCNILTYSVNVLVCFQENNTNVSSFKNGIIIAIKTNYNLKLETIKKWSNKQVKNSQIMKEKINTMFLVELYFQFLSSKQLGLFLYFGTLLYFPPNLLDTLVLCRGQWYSPKLFLCGSWRVPSLLHFPVIVAVLFLIRGVLVISYVIETIKFVYLTSFSRLK